jgi:hypothetical protein
MAQQSTGDPSFLTPNLRSPSNTLLHPGQYISPILANYLGQDTGFPLRNVEVHRTVDSSSVSSVITAPEPVAKVGSSDEYRMVNPNFEVKRGRVGSLAIPLDLSPLEQPALGEQKEKRRSRKLQKKRYSKQRSKSVGAVPERST